MIGHFPAPYPDELLYSVCARFSDRAEYRLQRAVVLDLFGTGNACAIIDLPSRLDALVANLPPQYQITVEDLIDEHTLLPFYAPFLPAERVQRLREDMRGNNGQVIRRRAGIVSSNFPVPERLRFCPVCVKVDQDNFGEGYWHRVHQAPGVEVCPTHAVWLEEGTAQSRHRRDTKEFLSAEQAIWAAPVRLLDLTDFRHQVLLALARDATWLLSKKDLVFGPAALHRRYTVAIINRGLATHAGTFHAPRFLQALEDYYPADLLQMLYCDLGTHVQPFVYWPCRLVRNVGKVQLPVKHLLVMHFLGYAVEQFFNLPTEYAPFGEGPWPCLNPVCDHYQQPLITECRWKMARSRKPGSTPVGVFVCHVCGFTYARTGPDQSPEDRFRRDRAIRQYGHVWESALARLWASDISIFQIARQLRVGFRTVERQAVRLGLSSSRSVFLRTDAKRETQPRPVEAQPLSLARRETYRNEWLALLKENPGANRTELQRLSSRVYCWLSRRDNEWFESHLPPRRKPRQPPSRVDWEARDRCLVAEVKPAVARILGADGYPVRVTKTAIGRETGRTGWLMYLDRLPLTAALLTDVVETIEEHTVRRVQWVAEQYRRAGNCPSRYDLAHRAGLGGIPKHPLVRSALDTALRQLTQMDASTGSQMQDEAKSPDTSA